MDELLLNIQLTILNFVLISLAVYISFAFYEFKKRNNVFSFDFINNVLAFSLIHIFEAVIIILHLLKQYNFLRLDKNIYTAILIILIIFCAVVIVEITSNYKKRHINAIPLIPITIIVSFFMSGIPINNALNLFYLIFIFYLIITIVFFSLTLKQSYKSSTAGPIYILGGSATIIVNHLVRHLWYFQFTLTIDLAISVFLLLGFFIYYYELYLQRNHNYMKEIEEKNMKITYLAYVDQITKLNNIYKLEDDLKTINSGLMMIINIGNFMNFNNFIGYDKANAVLFEIANFLKNEFKEPTKIYRFSLDRFIIIIDDKKFNVEKSAKKIIEMFEVKKFEEISLDIYIGSTEINEEKTYNKLIKELDITSKEAKKLNNKYAFFNELYNDNFEKTMNLQVELKDAIKNKAFSVLYQPKVCVANDSIEGLEALIRWNNNGNFVSPGVFIPMAEELGLINDIGKYVIDCVFDDFSHINNELNGISISINLSVYQLITNDFYQFVIDKLKEYEINPNQIIFEITETALINNIAKVNKTVKSLKNNGFRFSLDDFGTGYSSLYYASNLDIDEVKFDKIFADNLEDPKNKIMLEYFIQLFKEIGIETIIEGIETKKQLEIIKDISCESYQGFYFSKPDRYENIIKKNATKFI